MNRNGKVEGQKSKVWTFDQCRVDDPTYPTDESKVKSQKFGLSTFDQCRVDDPTYVTHPPGQRAVSVS